MKHFTLLILLSAIGLSSNGQRYMTKDGFISFFSHTPLEDIKAENNQVASVVDISSGEIVFQVLIKSFHFERALMEEHFNENYMESVKFPKSTFKGKIVNLPEADLKKNGTHEVLVEGDLTIRDITRKVSVKGTLEVLQGGINAEAKFNIAPEDYNIKIPGVVREKIAKSFEVTVKLKYSPV